MSFSLLFFPAGRKGGHAIGQTRYRKGVNRMERVLMRIAVASEGLEVAPRFRQCASYMCYRVERGIIVECQNLPNPGLAAPKLVALLVEMGVDTLIVGAIDYDIFTDGQELKDFLDKIAAYSEKGFLNLQDTFQSMYETSKKQHAIKY